MVVGGLFGYLAFDLLRWTCLWFMLTHTEGWNCSHPLESPLEQGVGTELPWHVHLWGFSCCGVAQKQSKIFQGITQL